MRYVSKGLTPEAQRALDAIENQSDVPDEPARQLEVLTAAISALRAGAEAPLEYIGAGMTSVVFCDPHFAFKVARGKPRMLADEAEWLRTAESIPEVRPYIAKLDRWDPKHSVIVRECVRGRPGGWSSGTKIRELWDKIAPYMLAEGWLMPELKEDSVIFMEDGTPKIVDAGFASKVSNRLLGYVEDILDGKIDPESYEDYSTLAFYVRTEFGQRVIDEARAYKLLDRLYGLGAAR